MIPVSDAIHNALRAGNKQRALLYFVDQGLYLTANDIVMGSFTYTGSFNPDVDLTVGKTASASLNYSLINQDGALNTFTFGEFNAYMGVKTGEYHYIQGDNANVVLDFNGNRYAGNSTVPYLTKNGEALSYQPSSPVEAMVAIDDILYCITSTKTVVAISQTNATKWQDLASKTWLSQASYTWDSYAGSYSIWTTTITDDLTWKICERYIADHMGVSIDDNSRGIIFENGVAEVYDYTQIGHFYTDRPAKVRVNAISVQAYDAMEAKLNVLTQGLTTPTTLQGLYNQILTKTGLVSKVSTLLNSALPVPSTDFSDMTYREVLGLIAEASGTYALIDYDGKLDMRWFSTTGFAIDNTNYTEFVPYEYTVKPIDKLQVRSTDSDVGIVVGSGTNGYVIQNHPFFVFSSDSAGRPYCQNLYNRLSSLGAFTPGSLRWFTDFTIQPGDIISVTFQDTVYTFPIYMQNYTWSGICIGQAETTGNEYREVLNATNRKEWREQSSQAKRYSEITTTIDGITAKTGIENLTTGETLYSKISANATAISTEVTRASTAEGTLSSRITQNATAISTEVTRASTAEGTLSSRITQNTESFQATFKKIGASGYTATGITTISETGIKVTHSSVSNCYTEMTASGFQIKNSSNTVIGGLMTLNNQVCTAMNTIYNPNYPTFKTDVGSYTPVDTEGTSSGNGLSLKYNGTEFFHIGRNIYQSGYAQYNELYSAQGLQFYVNGGFIIGRRDSGAYITFQSNGDIAFSYKIQNVTYTKRVSELAVQGD